MRDKLQEWVTTYPRSPGWRDGSFGDAPEADLVRNEVPNAIRDAFPNLGGVVIKGSAGQGGWTDTPWVALLDQAVTTTVQEGYYIVYLLSLGGERLYLTIAQGCTELKNRSGIPSAREELQRRAGQMRSRIGSRASRLQPIDMELGSDSWRAQLYEAGMVEGVEYQTDALPSEDDLRQDLREALALYHHLAMSGGWSADDEIMVEAREERGSTTLEQAKVYRQHRTIERQPGHSREVKRRQGTTCKGCDKDLAVVYGETARGLIDAHHLTPLSSLKDGEVARFDALKDFAVLCPNCHRVIHRMPDVSDVPALRNLIALGLLKAAART